MLLLLLLLWTFTNKDNVRLPRNCSFSEKYTRWKHGIHFDKNAQKFNFPEILECDIASPCTNTMQILAFLLVRYSTDKNTKFSAKALFSKPFVIVNFYIAVVLVVLEVFKTLWCWEVVSIFSPQNYHAFLGLAQSLSQCKPAKFFFQNFLK